MSRRQAVLGAILSSLSSWLALKILTGLFFLHSLSLRHILSDLHSLAPKVSRLLIPSPL